MQIGRHKTILSMKVPMETRLFYASWILLLVRVVRRKRLAQGQRKQPEELNTGYNRVIGIRLFYLSPRP